jgi:hypothetical protein
VTPSEERYLREQLAKLYTREGVETWMANARKKRLTFAQAMRRVNDDPNA